MTISATGALAIELRPASPTQWVATYYPMVETPAGRWAEVTWELHQHLMSAITTPLEPARWLDARSPDPAHPCYAGHQAWAAQLAAGYATALAVRDTEATEATEAPLSAQETQLLGVDTFVVPAGQLSEWVLDDLEGETSDACG
ncbi:hypothetical protein [Kocuria sp. SM24M-10]|uniref:hypothetical protein n=1 Tax=Kocuria sp. SM24M-10 TaxID=1660349 RepID=UPI00064A0C01|nr:hypothetical protein [Kocuria sp. SM24M-10]KLU10092.1 hypothetical protein ABL57_08635 [Kocuria sp. SM24M-10]